MWQKIIDALLSIVKIQGTVDKHDKNIEDLLREVQRLTVAVQVLVREVEHLRETDAKERKMMALELENVLLKFEKRLPAPKNQDNE